MREQRADHPSPEELAAYHAGEVEAAASARLAAHVEACPACAAVLDRLASAGRRLAALPEPAPPAGLHERLTAAIAAERQLLARSRQRSAWYRRPPAWVAAAAVLLAAASLGLSSMLRNATEPGGLLATGGGGEPAQEQVSRAPGGAPAAPSLSGGGASRVPVVAASGAWSLERLRAELDGRPELRALLGGVRPERALGAGGDRQGGGDDASPGSGGDLRALPQADVSACQAYLGPGRRPAFLLAGGDLSYQGREGSLLVVADTSRPGWAELWLLPDGTCGGGMERLGAGQVP